MLSRTSFIRFSQKMGDQIQWEIILQEMEKRVPKQQYRAWVEPIHFLSVKDGKLKIGAPTQFNCDWIKEHFRDDFEQVVQQLYNVSLEIDVTVSEGLAPPQLVQESHLDLRSDEQPESLIHTKLPQNSLDLEKTPESVEGNERPSNSSSSKQTENHKEESFQTIPIGPTPIVKTVAEPLNPKLTFETFVVGASNQFAHAACRAVADQPATQYNPLFIYSEAGLGKTHLLHAIGNSFLLGQPKAKICYLSAETFANELIESLRNQRMPQFRQKYRDSFDILLMDDFQFIAGKDRTQEEFFHTFNALHSSRRQIVVTSDKSPKDIPGLEDRIRTRFECGLIADIQAPEIETRIAILRAKAERDDVFLPDAVALFLASNIKTNIRELEGGLVRLEAQASLNGVEISLELAKRELSTILKEPITAVSADAILSAVSRYFNLRVADLKSRDRSRKFSLPRQIAMFLLRKYTGKSLPEIGLSLGGKDHSTVLHGINSVTKALDTDPIIQKHVIEIQNML